MINATFASRLSSAAWIWLESHDFHREGEIVDNKLLVELHKRHGLRAAKRSNVSLHLLESTDSVGRRSSNASSASAQNLGRCSENICLVAHVSDPCPVKGELCRSCFIPHGPGHPNFGRCTVSFRTPVKSVTVKVVRIQSLAYLKGSTRKRG